MLYRFSISSESERVARVWVRAYLGAAEGGVEANRGFYSTQPS